MISLAWPLTVVVLAVLALVAFERHAGRTRATSETLIQPLASRVEALDPRVAELERSLGAFREIVLKMSNAQRFGK